VGKIFSPSVNYYDCGICGALHAVEWDGDCRQDNARLNMEDLDEQHGPYGWNLVPMPGGEEGFES